MPSAASNRPDDSPALPSRTMDEGRLEARFGAAGLALAREMAAAGDPLADAVIAELNASPRTGNQLLRQGIRAGLASMVDAPPAVSALLRDTETLPAWADPASLARGCEAYLSIGALWMSVSLGPGSLAHTYSSPAIAEVLMATGNLAEKSPRRLLETAVWQQQAFRGGGLAVGTEGYIHTLEVRVLHARVRAGMLARGWDSSQQGMPVSQIDMLRTWLDFTYVPFTALSQLGIDFTDDEFRDLYHAWQLVAHLLGIDPRYYRRITDQATAAEMLELVDTAAGEPSNDCALLTVRMLDAAAQRLAPALGMPPDVALGLMHAFCRLFHGDAFADRMGVMRSWWSGLLPVFANANRFQRLMERQDPALRQQKIAITLATFAQQLETLQGETTYQSHLSAPVAPGFPQT